MKDYKNPQTKEKLMPITTSVLGAETGGLESLAGELGNTAVGILDVQATSNSIATEVVGQMQTSFQAAMGRVSDAMGDLGANVSRAHSQMDSTTWSGRNASIFNDGYLTFKHAMDNFQGHVHTAYEEFHVQLNAMGESIERFQALASGALQDANESTLSMQNAVAQQQANLESAMNDGMSFGGAH